MNHSKTKLNRIIVAKLSPDEDVTDAVTQIVKHYDIQSGSIKIIGALKKCTLGYFNINKKIYKFNTYEENLELLNCMGNIAYKDGEPIIHLHCIVGREDNTVLGGHLGQPSIISVTGEVFIHETEVKLQRTRDTRFDLSLLKFK
jgi:hypothetical protein